MENIKLDIHEKIHANTVLLFDMDGTLVDTDFANFLSYKSAIMSVIGLDGEIEYNPNERFNRTTLKAIVPNLSDQQYNRIIQQKEENYNENLSETRLKNSVVEILMRYSKTNKAVLVTNCREDRALKTLDYHGLTDKFSNIFFREVSDDSRINKYEKVMSSLSLSPQSVLVFENEKQEISDAILAGISINNILSI